MVNHVLRNALKFTASPMILSLEREAYGGSGALWCSIYGKTELYLAQSHPDRVRINPQASVTTGPALLAAHWSNLAFCEQPGLPCGGPDSGDIRFVMLNGEQLFFRPGLEEWVTQHSVAFCPSGDCSNLPARTAPNCVRQPRPATVRAERSDAAELGTLLAGASKSPNAAHSAWPVLPHDGAFFPLWLLRDFSRAARRSSPELMRAFEHLRRGGSCGRNRSVDAACALHQSLLPTFVRERHARLIPTASSPILFPLGKLGNASLCGGVESLANTIRSMAAPEPRVFGVSLRGTWFAHVKESVIALATSFNRGAEPPSSPQLFRPLPPAADQRCANTCEPAQQQHGFSDCVKRGNRHQPVDCRPVRRDRRGQQLVACVGDSITSGVQASSADHSYPAVLQRLLGRRYKVTNLGAPGTQLQRLHPLGSRYQRDPDFRPYWTTAHFARLNSTDWDVVVIMLGTNDARNSHLLRTCAADATGRLRCPGLADSLTSLITQLRSNGVPRVLVAVPPPLLRHYVYGLDQSSVNERISEQVRAVAEANREHLAHPPIDVFGAFGGPNQTEAPWECSMLSPRIPRCELLSCDRTHPSDAGYEMIAGMVHRAIVSSSCRPPPAPSPTATE